MKTNIDIEQFSPEVLSLLKRSGWTPERDEGSVENNFKNKHEELFAAAAGFLRCYGGLCFSGRMWIWSEPVADHELLHCKESIGKVANCKVVGVATSNYLGDGCVVWIDEKGRFFASDSEGMIFIGHDEYRALDVLLLGVPPSEPPAELLEGLKDSYSWSATEKP